MTDEAKTQDQAQGQAAIQEPQAQTAAVASAPKKAPATLRSLLGIKRGMTQIFDNEGHLYAVTEVEAGPCTILQIREKTKNGYDAVQIGFRAAEEKQMNRPLAGQFKRLNLPAMKHIREIRVKDCKGFEAGQILDLEGRFTPGDYIDVQGISKGKGFQGAMKRHGFRGMPASHGASDKERSPGSLAARRSLGRVLPGQRMAGHMGHETVTVHKMEVVQVDPARHLLYINGAVPGPSGSLILVSETVKNKKRKVAHKQPTILRDKMGNIIKGKGAKARAQAETKVGTPTKPAPAEKK